MTIPDDRGVILPTTWQMCPPITAFTSELFYEIRLEAKPVLERQALGGTGRFDGSGLWLVPASHDGNRTSSVEETELVEKLVRELTGRVGPRKTASRGSSLAVTFL